MRWNGLKARYGPSGVAGEARRISRELPGSHRLLRIDQSVEAESWNDAKKESNAWDECVISCDMIERTWN